jgi:hypothetical protein
LGQFDGIAQRAKRIAKRAESGIAYGS